MFKFTATMCAVATMKLWRSTDAAAVAPMTNSKQIVDELSRGHVAKLSEYRNNGFTAGRKRSVTTFVEELKDAVESTCLNSTCHAETVEYLQSKCQKAQQQIDSWQNIKPEGKLKTENYYRGYKAQLWLYCTGVVVLSNNAEADHLSIWMFNRKEFTTWFRAQQLFDQSEAVQADHAVCSNPLGKPIHEVVTCVNDVCTCIDEDDFVQSFDDIFYGFLQWIFTTCILTAALFFAISQQMNWIQWLNFRRAKKLKRAASLRKASSRKLQ